MNKENIYIGNILICEKYMDRYSIKLEGPKFKIYKENAILIKVKEHYIDIDDIKNNIDLIKNKGYKTYYTHVGDKFVDPESLYRYTYSNERLSIKKLKKK